MDKYYLVSYAYGELDIKEFSREELDKFFEEEDMHEYFGADDFFDKFPKNNEWKSGNLLLIKGNVIKPEKVDVVTKWRI